MKNLRRRKILFISAAAISTLGVILWSTYVFTAIWLRVRCARELAARAEPFDAVRLGDQVSVKQSGPNSFFDGNLALYGFTNSPDDSDLMGRLESLQRPTIGTLLQLLLGRAERDEPQGIELVHTIALDRSARFLTMTEAGMAVQLWDGQSDTPDVATLHVSTVNAPDSVSAGQALFNVMILESNQTTHCHSVTDSDGDQVLLVTRPLPQEEGDPQSAASVPGLEITLIDSAGRILDRSRLPRTRLLGKLADPRGKADQLVFGTPYYARDQDGTFQLDVIGPGVVCIVEAGRLKAIQTIDPPRSSEGDPCTKKTPDPLCGAKPGEG